MLIMLDNARDTAQVVPLLPGGEARQLLARHLGRTRLDAEPDAAAILLACCAGLPLALSIVAARATTRPHLSLTALAAELGDSTCRLDALDAGEPQADLRAVLSWSSHAHALSPDAARAFGLLGIAPGPDIAPAAAASLLALPPAAARTLLRELDHAHLIQRHTPERYRMHDLLRLHATEQARDQHIPAERQAALRRLVDFYVHTACAGARLLAPHHPVPCRGNQPLARQYTRCPTRSRRWPGSTPNTPACWPPSNWPAATAGTPRSASWPGRWTPTTAAAGHLEDQATAWQLAVACARQLHDPAIRAQAHQMLGDAYAQLGRTTDALHHLRQALALAEHAGDIAGQAEIHHSLGGTWERHGDDRRALEHAHHALLIFRALDNTFRQARALNGVGWLQTRLGDYAKARANCQAALALLRQDPRSNRQLGESHILDSLGYIAHCLREYDHALDCCHQALAICRAQGHRFLEPDLLHHIAETHLAQHRPDQARDTWRRARELYTTQHRLANAQRVQQQLDSLDGTVISAV